VPRWGLGVCREHCLEERKPSVDGRETNHNLEHEPAKNDDVINEAETAKAKLGDEVEGREKVDRDERKQQSDVGSETQRYLLPLAFILPLSVRPPCAHQISSFTRWQKGRLLVLGFRWRAWASPAHRRFSDKKFVLNILLYNASTWSTLSLSASPSGSS